ncbi:unnamed protein product [Rhizoctonia solani]|uniref:DUF6533 domain-containing protein n=1 Tax=Rhizoctonia solani TaxID=456999 RepID=A0A8H3A9D3_9AGAM|nr:unnamed protein product [Rhizoctonia solani]
MSLYTHSKFDTSYVALVASESQYKRFLDLIIKTRMQGMIARHLAVSGIALLLYDWLTNLDKEAEYAWARKWSIARVVYHLNRVLPILLIGAILIPDILFAPAHFTPSTSVQSLGSTKDLKETNIHERCRNVTLLYSYGVIAMMAIVCITSIIRCWALYGQRWVLWVLIPSHAITVGHATWRVTGTIKRAIIMANPFPEFFQGCLITIPNDIWLAYVSGVFFELVVFCMVVWRIWYLGHGLGLTPLMKQLLTNVASFFAVNLALILFSCVGSAYPSTIVVANGSGCVLSQ